MKRAPDLVFLERFKVSAESKGVNEGQLDYFAALKVRSTSSSTENANQVKQAMESKI